MDDITKIQEQHTAGPQAAGFDYQFYYFIFLALELKHGQKIGFEVKDDVHIEKEDGGIILFQAKHTTLKKINNSAANLTSLDIDLWKTLNNWSEMIKIDSTILSNYFFCLITNKSDGNNRFKEILTLYKAEGSIDSLLRVIEDLRDKTENPELKKYIKNVLSIRKKEAKQFYSKLTIETDTDNIIQKIKDKIYQNIRNRDLVDPVFESLLSNMQEAKYVDIKDRKKFEISFSEFNSRFGKCFRIAFKDKPLPKRQFPIKLPEKLDEQTFIKQLIDIGEIDSNSNKIIDYTTQMLQVVNNLSYWVENNFILPTEMDEFKRDSIIKWENEFRAKYRQIEKRISQGTPIEDLDAEIKTLGLELVDAMRRESLTVAGDNLGTALSNGHYYNLSDKPEIGWHFDWTKKYKAE